MTILNYITDGTILKHLRETRQRDKQLSEKNFRYLYKLGFL